MSPEELAFLGTAISVVLAKDKSIEDIQMLSAILDQVSITLTTIALQRTKLEASALSDTSKEEYCKFKSIYRYDF